MKNRRKAKKLGNSVKLNGNEAQAPSDERFSGGLIGVLNILAWGRTVFFTAQNQCVCS